ncbi:DHS-like NAD/FAD-binding domain-containing protein [Auricularia subglabra TFB-10046 SS5]|nr:DHS-like NAD/FAD-binding domain-containing protein [Auricularia subglabra TFB-10046 SS5]
MSDDANAFRAAFAKSKHIVVIAGAGLSAASGIPTFRDGGGMWRSLDPTKLATPEAFAENPSLVWQFYHYRRTKALAAKPNAAHHVIAKMSVPDHLRKVAPEVKTFHLVTQNVDRLSVNALASLASGGQEAVKLFPNSILEMHGRIYDVKCTSCDYCEEKRADSLCPALGTTDSTFDNYNDAGTKEVSIPLAHLPQCAACGALARPGVVWFNEKPYHLDEINSIVYKADMCLVIGTSSTVRPASTYAYRVRRHGGKVAVLNLAPDENNAKVADFVFTGGCETVLPSLFPELV